MEQIHVTKAFLPPMEEYEEYLKRIWDTSYLTNQGPLLLEFETKVSDYLGVSEFQFISNGTLGLQLGLRALGITDGEVITTPFSYVATTSAILWERCQPVYVDIDPKTLCIDPEKIEAAITSRTKAIMAVHVFGNPCETKKIEAIAQKNNIKVIYDAAHAFGVIHDDRSLLENGDISICSFHATKLFQTIEGGGIVARDKSVSANIELMKRFGHNGDDHIMLGINAKASEFQAAMGLCNLKYVDELIERRKSISELYDRLLGDAIDRPQWHKNTRRNHGYYPVILKNEEELNRVTKELNDLNIFPRRYFYPSLNTLPYVEKRADCPISEDIASRILCLPIYPDLDHKVVNNICEVIKR